MEKQQVPRFWRFQKQRYSLVGEICPDCKSPLFPPRDVCPHCGGDNRMNLERTSFIIPDKVEESETRSR